LGSVPRAFVAAWLLGAAALVAGEWWDPARLALIPGGAIVTAAGVALSRHSRTPAGRVEHVVVRAWGIDVRRYARLAGTLLTVLGLAWLLTGATEALT
jgi:hypothetical protein